MINFVTAQPLDRFRQSTMHAVVDPISLHSNQIGSINLQARMIDTDTVCTRTRFDVVDAVTGAKPKVVLRSLYTVYSRGDCMVGRWYGVLYA